jgi:hypothetical protein
MIIQRIVPNLSAGDISKARQFYGTPVPELSIEVDDLQEALSRIQAAGIAIEYGPVTEEWGVRRFYVRVRQTLEHTFAYLSHRAQWTSRPQTGNARFRGHLGLAIQAEQVPCSKECSAPAAAARKLLRMRF